MEVYKKTHTFAPSNDKKLHIMEKIEVTQDELKTFFDKHCFILSAIADKMGVTDGIVGNCFSRTLNRHGKPLSFSKKNIELMNMALQQISEELSMSKLKCSDDGSTRRFINDDPSIIESLRKISQYIKLRGMTYNVLGWGSRKCESNIKLKGPNPHVHLKKEEIELINNEILTVAGSLAKWELVGDKPKD